LSFLFSTHDEAFTVIIRKGSNIKFLNDLPGKTLNIGKSGSGARAVLEKIMTAKNWTYDTFRNVTELGVEQQAAALCNGDIDAMIVSAGHPNAMIQDATDTCEIRIIDAMDDEVHTVVNQNQELVLTKIPGGTYLGVPKDVATIGTKAVFLTTNETSETLAYEITRLVFENLDGFRKLDPIFETLDPKNMATQGRIAPYHPGAEKYYKEQKLIP
jgi:TRAP transporter TAXI family solute receptor